MNEKNMLDILTKIETAYLLVRRTQNIETKNCGNAVEYAQEMLCQCEKELSEAKSKIRKIVIDDATWRVDEALAQATTRTDACDKCAWNAANAGKGGTGFNV